MIKKYMVTPTPMGLDSGLPACCEVVCDIQVDPDNGQGLIVDKTGNLIFTVGNNDIVVFASGTWAHVTSE